MLLSVMVTPAVQSQTLERITEGEQGLLGLAFHPHYPINRRFFVYLTNSAGAAEIREYRRSTNADSASLGSSLIIRIVPIGAYFLLLDDQTISP